MRQLVLAAGAVCAAGWLAVRVAGQGPAMPGQVIGTGYNLPQVGNRLPAAGQKVGTAPNNAMMRPYDPARPLDQLQGTNIDPATVLAPVAGFGDQSGLDKFYAKLKSMVGVSPRVGPTRPNVTPGIFRRNRERAEERMWRRD